jgi:hypothetical protein
MSRTPSRWTPRALATGAGTPGDVAVDRRAIAGLATLATLIALLAISLTSDGAPAPAPSDTSSVEAAASYGELPLSFQPNRGRYEPSVDYIATSKAGTLTLGSAGATLTPSAKGADPVRLSLEAGSLGAPIAASKLPGVVNDLRGDDPARHLTDIPTYGEIVYPGAYPGIDLAFHGTSGTLEYDFRLAPRADPEQIGLRFGGAGTPRIAGNGDLVVGHGSEAIRQAAPVSYQPTAAGRVPVDSRFVLEGRTVGFELGAYDDTRRLVIDPVVLDYSTYLGGSNADFGRGIAVDSTGAAYVAGTTYSTDFDLLNEVEPFGGSGDVFVSKLTPAGDALVYSTYLGGAALDEAEGIAIDAGGAAYVTGETSSSDFTTLNQVQSNAPANDAFVAKLTPAGNALVYSTYLGGNGSDGGDGIAVDSAGAAYVSGGTASTDFPLVNSISGDQGDADGFVTKLNPAGTALVYSTYLGGSGVDGFTSIAIDGDGAAYVTGQTSSVNYPTVNAIEGDSALTDIMVSKLNPAGTALAYSTYLGGSSFEFGSSIAVDPLGAAYITGVTGSTDFDLVNPIESGRAEGDAFASKLTPAGTALEYSTALGGSGEDLGNAIAVDANGAAYVAGSTDSTDYNVAGPLEGDSGGVDAFVSKLSLDGGSLVNSTYLGGGGDDTARAIAIDASGAAYVTGSTDSSDFDTAGPIEGDSATDDAFISKLVVAGPDTRIDSGPSGLTQTEVVTFTYSGVPSAASFQCDLAPPEPGGSPGFSPCPVSGIAYGDLPDGAYTFSVRALDASANADPTPATRGFELRCDAARAAFTEAKQKLKKAKKKLKKAKKKLRAAEDAGDQQASEKAAKKVKKAKKKVKKAKKRLKRAKAALCS